MRPPWESEQAAFSFLLRVLAVCVAFVLLVALLRLIF
jgi:hypothetical protein